MGRSLVDPSEFHRVSAGSSSLFAESSSFRELDDVFLQTQTRIWLGEVLHTRLDEEMAIADLLADGKVLFQVSKVVWKMLLTKCMKLRHSKAYFSESNTSGKCSGRYMPYSNVDSFLKICQILGLTGIDLFSPSDVVEKRDIRRVCMCIRSLSKKAIFKDLNVPDFDVVTRTVAMPTDMVECIRKSYELPKNNWGVEYARQDDSYSEESDDAEINYRLSGIHSPASTISCSEVSLLTSDVENSLGRNSLVAENLNFSPNTFHSDDQIEDKYGKNNLQYIPVEAMGSLSALGLTKDDNHFNATQLDMLSPLGPDFQMELTAGNQCVNKRAVRIALLNPENGTRRFDLEDRDLKNNASFEQNFFPCELSNSDLNNCGTYSGGSTLFDGGRKESAFNFHKEASFHVSNSIYKTPRYHLRRRYPDEIEDPSISPTASLNTDFDEVDTINYEDKFEVTDDISSSTVQLPQHQGFGTAVYKGIHSLKGYESQESVDNMGTDINKLHPDMNLDDINCKPIATAQCPVVVTSNECKPCGVPDLVVSDHLSPNYDCCSRVRVSGDSKDSGRAIDDVGVSRATFSGSGVHMNRNLDTSFSSVECFGNRFTSEAILPTKEANSIVTVMGGSSLKYHSINISHSNAIQYNSTLDARVDSKEGEYTVSPTDGGFKGLDLSNAKSTSYFHENVLSVDNLCCDSIKEQSNLDNPEEKPVQPSRVWVPNHIGQSENQNQIRVMESSVDILGGLEDSNPSDCDTYMSSTVNVDSPAVHHNGSVPYVLSTGSEYCTASLPSENVGKYNGSGQHIVDGGDLRIPPEGLNEEDMSQGMKDSDKEKGKHEESWENIGQPAGRPRNSVVLKSFAGAVSLLGVFFVLFQLRRKSNGENIGETGVPSVYTGDANHERTSRQKTQEKLKADGVYPSEKLRF